MIPPMVRIEMLALLMRTRTAPVPYALCVMSGGGRHEATFGVVSLVQFGSGVHESLRRSCSKPKRCGDDRKYIAVLEASHQISPFDVEPNLGSILELGAEGPSS